MRWILLILLLLLIFRTDLWIWLLIFAGCILFSYIIFKTLKRRPKEPNINNKIKHENRYRRKNSILTLSEKSFWNKLIQVINPNVRIFPQIVLSSVVEKIGSHYQSELSYVCDFGLFTADFQLICLIEYNDKSHHEIARRIRDNKVKTLCNSAEIDLVTFWTHFSDGKPCPNKLKYIAEHLLKESPNFKEEYLQPLL